MCPFLLVLSVHCDSLWHAAKLSPLSIQTCSGKQTFNVFSSVSASMCCTFPTRDSGYRDVGLKIHPFRESARVPGTLIRSFNVVFFAVEEDLTSFGDKSEKSESCWKSSSTYFALKRDRPTWWNLTSDAWTGFKILNAVTGCYLGNWVDIIGWGGVHLNWA